MRTLLSGLILLAVLGMNRSGAQDMTAGWTKTIDGADPAGHPDTRWFQDAKFGLFVHWGLYSLAGNEWKGQPYFGSAEWLMNRAKIPADDYAQLAARFNPVNFQADEWARFAREAGARYLVITAKHHEGFAMFGSKVSPYNIVDATPYHRDPMTDLAAACGREGVKFGFYYSQFLDWHEANGGGNTWDFKGPKDTKRYYAEKSIPQIKELLSHYGPLGIVWFDMPGGLSREETLAFIGQVRGLQPQCLISSRVGRGLGDFRDFGDSELPPDVIAGPWEALFTHNDSWGYAKNDSNFKTPREVLRLLASTAARGGNLLLNVGPDGTGRIPDASLRYLREVGQWLARNGESIYGTTHSPIPDQPWGVGTLKPGRLFLHVFTRPADGALIVPDFGAAASRVGCLGAGSFLPWEMSGGDLRISLPPELPDARDTVVEVDFSGTLKDGWTGAAALISRQYEAFALDAAGARVRGRTEIKTLTHSGYFGNWKHDTCAVGQRGPDDAAEFPLRFLAAGDYRITLEYACPAASRDRDGQVELDGQRLDFRSLLTGEYETHQPLLFLRHAIGIITVATPGNYPLTVRPRAEGAELFHLRRVVIEPVR